MALAVGPPARRPLSGCHLRYGDRALLLEMEVAMTKDERRVRRLARNAGLLLRKSRCRNSEAPGFGGFVLVNPALNGIVAGGGPYAFSLSLETAEAWIAARS